MKNKVSLLPLCAAIGLPLLACDLPEEVVGETAGESSADGGEGAIPGDGEPSDPDEEPSDPDEEPSDDDEEPSDDDSEDPEDEPADDDAPDIDPPSSTPEIIATIGGALAVDDQWLFVGTFDDNVPLRLPKSGGEPEPVTTSSSLSSVALLALDEEFVYWTQGLGSSGFSVNRALKTGGELETVTTAVGPNLASASAIAVDATHVYLTQPDIFNANDGAESLQGVIRRVPKAGGAVQDIADDYSRSLALADGSLYWTRTRLDGGSDLIRSDSDGSNIGVASSELGSITDITTAGSRVYWVVDDAGEQQVRTMQAGEDAQTLYSQLVDESTLIARPVAGETSFLWLDAGGAADGAVLGVDLEGTLTELAAAPASATTQGFGGPYERRIGIDETAVYWSYEGLQGGSARIYRLAR